MKIINEGDSLNADQGQLRETLERNGFAVVHGLVHESDYRELIQCFERTAVGAGRRNGLEFAPVRRLAMNLLARPQIADLFDSEAFAVRAILFDKTPDANWLVAWHQDITIPVRARTNAPGYASWSMKDGIPHVRPPARVLESMLTVRVELDGTDRSNGPLCVVPGSHLEGILAHDHLARALAAGDEMECLVPAGGALLMRPLLLHRSSRASLPRHRRVVHLEFASDQLPGGIDWR